MICGTLTSHYFCFFDWFQKLLFYFLITQFSLSEYLWEAKQDHATFTQEWLQDREKCSFIYAGAKYYLFIYYLVRTSTAKAGEILNFVMQTKYRPFLLIKIKLTPSTFWNRHTYRELTPPWPFIHEFSSHWYYPWCQSTITSNSIWWDNHT